MAVHRIQLVCWNEMEAAKRAAALRLAGYRVSSEPLANIQAIRKLRDDPPAAVVIDLNRRPSQGRDVAVAIRHQKATRHVPLVLVEGDPDKVEGIRRILPDAAFTNWGRIRSALKRAIAQPPVDPVTPRSVLDHYSGAPLKKKLGIKPESTLSLVHAPPGFEDLIAPLPPGVEVHHGLNRASDLILWFVKDRAELARGLVRMTAAMASRGGLWIAWPKKASGMNADICHADVQRAGLDAGLMDFKIVAVDATWSALRFTRNKR